MYLVSAENFSGESRKKSPPLVSDPKLKSRISTPLSKKKKKRKREKQQHPYDKWVKFRKNM